MKSVYWVWRRSDGYVSSSKGANPPSNGGRDTFEVLLETEVWAEARAAVEANRDERHQALVASWEN